MPIEIIRQDITRLRVDAIVNATNRRLSGGGGVDRAIHRAGGPGLDAACRRAAPCEPGEAVITEGYGLPAKYVIHTVGPAWYGGRRGERAVLAACYTSAMALAAQRGCRSVAFPVIAAGFLGVPRETALKIATESLRQWLATHEDLQVYLVTYDRRSFRLSRALQAEVKQYIDDHYVEARDEPRREAVQRPSLTDGNAPGPFPGSLSRPFPQEDAFEANAPVDSAVADDRLRDDGWDDAFADADFSSAQSDATPGRPARAWSDEDAPELAAPPNRRNAMQAHPAEPRPDAEEPEPALPSARSDATPRQAARAWPDEEAPQLAASPSIRRGEASGRPSRPRTDGDRLSPEPPAFRAKSRLPHLPLPSRRAGSTPVAPPPVARGAVFSDSGAFPDGAPTLDELLGQLDESFSQMVLRKITERGITDAACYKRANLDRKLFSKIRSDVHYRPSKRTALALAIALELPMDELRELLMKAGFALSHSSKFDVIIEYFVLQGRYDIDEINQTLFAFDQQLLGA